MLRVSYRTAGWLLHPWVLLLPHLLPDVDQSQPPYHIQRVGPVYHHIQPSLERFSGTQRFFSSGHPTFSTPVLSLHRSPNLITPTSQDPLTMKHLKLRPLCIPSPGITIGTNPSCQSQSSFFLCSPSAVLPTCSATSLHKSPE